MLPCWEAGEISEDPPHRTVFDIEYPVKFKHDSSVPLRDDQNIHVFTDCRHGYCCMTTDVQPMLYEDFLLHHPRVAKTRKETDAPKKPRVAADTLAELLRTNPWLRATDFAPFNGVKRCGGQDRCSRLLFKLVVQDRCSRSLFKIVVQDRRSRSLIADSSGAGGAGSSGAGSSGTGGDPGGDAEPDPGESDADPDEVELDPAEVADDLRDIRDRHAVPRVDDEAFFFKVLGGNWTRANKGAVADAAGGYCKHELAKMWCGVFDWPKQNAFYFSRYGEFECAMMAHEYVRRSNYYFNIWFHDSDGDFHYTDEQRHCPEDAAFEEWLAALDPLHPAKARAEQLKALRPGPH